MKIFLKICQYWEKNVNIVSPTHCFYISLFCCMFNSLYCATGHFYILAHYKYPFIIITIIIIKVSVAYFLDHHPVLPLFYVHIVQYKHSSMSMTDYALCFS